MSVDASVMYFKDLAPIVADRIAQRHELCYRSALAQIMRLDVRKPDLIYLGLTGREHRVDWQMWELVVRILRGYIDQGHDCGCVALWEGRGEDGRLLVH